MKQIMLWGISLLLIQSVAAQKREKILISDKDPYHFYVNDGDSTQTYYYEYAPEKPIGVLTIIPSSGESTENMLQKIKLHEEALAQNYIIIIPSYNWGTVQRTPDVQFLDTIFQKVLADHNVNKDNFFLCGLSNGGMMALSYGIHAVRDSNTTITPKGIIGIDPPLDLIHFYHYCEREVERNFSKTGVQEAEWLMKLYNMAFGGSPEDARQHYIHSSIYTYDEEFGGNTRFLNNINILMYSDLNVDFLLNERGRDLYDWNGSDIVAFVNQLKYNGNENAEVIISQNKGRRADGSIHPHSWNILDTNKTITWMNTLIKQ